MILKITECNYWEREKWHYLIDIEKQEAYAINELFIFLRLAMKEFEKIKSENPNMDCLAISNYQYTFYDNSEITDNKTILIRKNSKLHMNMHSDYKSSNFNLDKIISTKRIHSAMISIRDKKENKLYKNFEYIFLQDKLNKLIK